MTEWESAKALDAAIANSEWPATVQRFVDNLDLHITARPAAYRVDVDVRPDAP